ncbi:arf-GAP with Rho-GAP domain, ANK repeat and PH domain-containing protein 2 isoform X2 [Lates japonicus]|uniref:Arf-GAP with Rho-GAP domain, ANK repeat and PH domain-containing protein 2 isoform X2 n=1 Tax=Lates japonicus TaxID=270547 RepID=A0AAD3R3I6_LATJO|nr:arf-GAP with Rho-GAP domain, ANK repeat and PH domain-containing protein 2 isoform X2 [Lates japonicus]
MHVSTGERQEWMETLQTATRPPACSSQKPSDSLSYPSSTNKRGLLELRGYKGRVLVSLAGSKVRLCKTEQFHLTECELSEADRCHDVISMRGSSNCSASSVRIFMQILSTQQQGGEGEVASDGKRWFV